MTEGDNDWRLRFFTIWTGQAISRFGSQVVSFALIWWLTEKTGSVGVLTVASLMTLLPPVFLGPIAGALVDRWDRRKILMVSDSTIALFSGILAFLYWRGIAAPWHIYGVMLVRAIGDSFHGPSTKASTTLMVPKAHLSRIAGMNQALNGALRIAAPPLGAVLL
jgi:DHA3 family macrolide efflux protein-like MFS transporter